MNIKITRRKKLYEVNNDMVHNWYYLINGRIYNDDNTMYRTFKFVEWFDVFDVQEYFEEDKINVKEYLEECISCRLGYINNFDDCQAFYDMCNDTINNWNKLAKHLY